MAEFRVRVTKSTASAEGMVVVPDGWSGPEPGDYPSAVFTPTDFVRFQGLRFMPNVSATLTIGSDETVRNEVDGTLLALDKRLDLPSAVHTETRLVSSAVMEFVVIQLICVHRLDDPVDVELTVMCSATQAEWATCAADFDQIASGGSVAVEFVEVSDVI